MRDLLTPQPDPVGGEHDVWEVALELARRTVGEKADKYHLQIFEDMRKRREQGLERYGTPLRFENGRDAFADLYQELLDSWVYSIQLWVEYGKDPKIAAQLGQLLNLLYFVRAASEARKDEP